MGDASRERPDGFELLGTLQVLLVELHLLLGPFALVDVAGNA